jgi:hypothetical protein
MIKKTSPIVRALVIICRLVFAAVHSAPNTLRQSRRKAKASLKSGERAETKPSSAQKLSSNHVSDEVGSEHDC